MSSELVPAVLLADDGELAEVRRLLDELGIEAVEAGESGCRRARVLVSNARRALARATGSDPGTLSCGFHIVVADKLSRTLRCELRRAAPDFLVERPVDSVALRLVILHALYSGPERRKSSRVAMSALVKCRVGLVSRAATLVEVSARGCRLATGAALNEGQSLTVILPPELTGARRVALEGCVVGTDPAGAGEPGRRVWSVAFQDLDPQARGVLRALIARQAAASGDLSPRAPAARSAESAVSPPGAPGDEAPSLAPAPPPARRRSARGSYRRSVLATGRGCSQVLIGRDLSAGGMRVHRDPSLGVGDELKLVIHGGPEPLLVKAVVARDDGEEGWVLQFRDLSPRAAAGLGTIVRALRHAQPPDLGTDRGPGTVVSEVVEER